MVIKEDCEQDALRPDAVVVEQETDNAPTEQEEARGRRRSAWKLFSTEDLPQLLLREILSGDYLIGNFLRRQIWLILLLGLMSVLYITNRYRAQQEILEEDRLRRELSDWKILSLSQAGELTRRTRQSHLEEDLRLRGDSTLKTPITPPYLIYY